MKGVKMQEQHESQAQPAPAQPQSDLLNEVIDSTLTSQMQALRYDTTVATYYSKSGYFGDTPAQSFVKLMIGRDLGLSPSVALMSVHVGKSGRPSLSGGLIAALLKRAGYSWRFVAHTPTECKATFQQNGEPLLDGNGQRVTVAWTYEHAKRALLAGKTDKNGDPGMYEKYGEDMLFNRMITRFQRRFAPEVTAGMTIYTPDELREIEESDVERALSDALDSPAAVDRAKAAVTAQEVAARKIAEMAREAKPPEPPEDLPEPPTPEPQTGPRELKIGRRG